MAWDVSPSADLVRAETEVNTCYTAARAVHYRPGSVAMQALAGAEKRYRQARQRYRLQVDGVVDLTNAEDRVAAPRRRQGSLAVE